MSLGGCRVPTPSEVNMVASYGDSACRAILDRFNYGGCYKRYRGDADFFRNEWYLWLGQEIRFDPEHDKVQLLDVANRVVDEYVY
jgi:hypothetical protein